jgi:cytochrome c
MGTMLRTIVITAMMGLSSLAAAADEQRATADEAVALVKKAIVYYKANGREKLAAEINSRTPQFLEKDLYLFMSPINSGALIAHGANAKMVGKTLGDMRDVDGIAFVQKFRDVANSKDGKGWVDYKWPNNKTGQIEQKSTYIERVDDIYLACGIYKPK